MRPKNQSRYSLLLVREGGREGGKEGRRDGESTYLVSREGERHWPVACDAVEEPVKVFPLVGEGAVDVLLEGGREGGREGGVGGSLRILFLGSREICVSF